MKLALNVSHIPCAGEPGRQLCDWTEDVSYIFTMLGIPLHIGEMSSNDGLVLSTKMLTNRSDMWKYSSSIDGIRRP